MNKRILGGLAAAVMLAGGIAVSSSEAQATQGAGPLTVDGVVYQPTKIAGPTTHYETPDTNPESASNADHEWDGNGSEKLPCPFGIHWLSNANTLNVSHCLLDPNAPPPVDECDDYDRAPADFDDCEPIDECADYREQETLIEEDEEIECTKDPKVVYSEWIDGDFECDDTTVERTRDKTTTTYTWDGEEFDEETTVVQETETRDLTVDEQFDCPIPEVPETPVVAVIPPTAPTQRPPDVVSAFSPAQAPPAEVAALPPVAPTQALPSTGIDSTGITALIALLMTSLGGAALFMSRRYNATN